MSETSLSWNFVGFVSGLVVEDEALLSPGIKIQAPDALDHEIVFDLMGDADWQDGRKQALGWLSEELLSADVVLRTRVISGESVDPAPTQRKFDNAVSALRLLRTGSIGLTAMLWYAVDRPHEEFGRLVALRYPRWDTRYFLSPMASKRVSSLFEAINSADLVPCTSVALGYFNLSYDQEGSEVARLWNLWAALEALLWDDENDREYVRSALIPWRASRLTGIPEHHLRESYRDPRSKTIHGRRSAEIGADLVNQTEEASRRCLRNAFLRPASLAHARGERDAKHLRRKAK